MQLTLWENRSHYGCVLEWVSSRGLKDAYLAKFRVFERLSLLMVQEERRKLVRSTYCCCLP